MKAFLSSLVFLLTFSIQSGFGQWGAPYSNSWITYDTPYVKIKVSQRGIHKVTFSSLPAGFQVSQPGNLQLWHRGRQVALLSATTTEITFFGVPNDGSTDSLFYRPMSNRLNPYYSFYSDESAYFLVNGSKPGLRAETVDTPVNEAIANPPYNLGESLTVLKDEYTLSTENYVHPNFYNSFFELAASRSGKAQEPAKVVTFPFTLTNQVAAVDVKAKMEMLLHGRSNNGRNIEVYIGKDQASLRLVKTIDVYGFAGLSIAFDIEAGDVGTDNKGLVALKSLGTDRLERFSMTYYKITYPRNFNSQGQTSEFELPPADAAFSRISVNNAPANSLALDITVPDQPVTIIGSAANMMVRRTAGRSTRLYMSTGVINVAAAKLSVLTFKPLDFNTANYLVLTTDSLLTSATAYAAYRASSVGGKYNTLLVNINDVYNQFNYGEPSPVAIRRMVDYAISVGTKEKYLFIIGRSTTYNERMKRELPDEVPTVGFPASDNLLVEGLGGVPKDVPAIPIGRLAAINNQNVLDYLEKVKQYEVNASGDYAWRKTVLHLNGGKTSSEISQLKGELASLVPYVTDGFVGGKVIPFVKQQGIAEVERVNITPEVNAGAGLITYFGHGSVIVTDLDMGYATDPGRGYNNAQKYPMMYFNGCGVGNIFSGRTKISSTGNDRYPLSLDWLLAPRKGSVAIVANSFESYVSPSAKYLETLYKVMFEDPGTVDLPIGTIQREVARQILASDKGVYTISNIHQSVLQGDPALKLVTVAHADYALDPEESLILHAQAGKDIGSSDSLKLQILLSNRGRYIETEKVPLKITLTYADGTSVITKTIAAFPFSDSAAIMFPKAGKVLQKVEVNIDPENTITELTKINNIAVLNVDWELARNETVYPINTKDVVAPLLSVYLNNRLAKNEDIVGLNPALGFLLRDDRLIEADTSLINVFVKPCWDDNCDFTKLSFSSGDYRIETLSNRSFRILLNSSGLGVGEYELLVNARDVAGNINDQAYRIKFKVEENAANEFKVVCSPNPATSFIRLETSLGNYQNIQSVRYAVYSITGKLMWEDLQENVNGATQERYWQTNDQVPAGLYIYKVTKLTNDQGSEQATGKFVLTR